MKIKQWTARRKRTSLPDSPLSTDSRTPWCTYQKTTVCSVNWLVPSSSPCIEFLCSLFSSGLLFLICVICLASSDNFELLFESSWNARVWNSSWPLLLDFPVYLFFAIRKELDFPVLTITLISVILLVFSHQIRNFVPHWLFLSKPLLPFFPTLVLLSNCAQLIYLLLGWPPLEHPLNSYKTGWQKYPNISCKSWRKVAG